MCPCEELIRGSSGSFSDLGINIVTCLDDCRWMRQIVGMKARPEIAGLKATVMHHVVWMFTEVLTIFFLHSPYINLTTTLTLLSSLLTVLLYQESKL